ncbi:MAG: nicotinate (nicotinamide) nucleotide adenylyltransferase [Oscillospiraceae bacterium]
MRIAIFGGSFNPPHTGHIEAAKAALSALSADKLLIIPAAQPPHKEQPKGGPSAEERFTLARLAFQDLPKTEVSDLEQTRDGRSFTIDTLRLLKAQYPGAELLLLMGTDMLLCFEKWKDYTEIFKIADLAVFPRLGGEGEIIRREIARLESLYGVKIAEINFSPTEISSTELREKLQNREGEELVSPEVYEEIIRLRLYGAMPNLPWLRKMSYLFLDGKRIPHVRGCEEEAVRLAKRWDADPDLAAEAGILHDVTKKLNADEQLKLCEKYGILTDSDEKSNYKLLHSKTGAEFARHVFGVTDEVYSAIYWHTTAKENMSTLEKIIYMADYVEPNRVFPGVEKLRALAFNNLDEALILGLQMSLEELAKRGTLPHENSQKALKWLINHRSTQTY